MFAYIKEKMTIGYIYTCAYFKILYNRHIHVNELKIINSTNTTNLLLTYYFTYFLSWLNIQWINKLLCTLPIYTTPYKFYIGYASDKKIFKTIVKCPLYEIPCITNTIAQSTVNNKILLPNSIDFNIQSINIITGGTGLDLDSQTSSNNPTQPSSNNPTQTSSNNPTQPGQISQTQPNSTNIKDFISELILHQDNLILNDLLCVKNIIPQSDTKILIKYYENFEEKEKLKNINEFLNKSIYDIVCKLE